MMDTTRQAQHLKDLIGCIDEEGLWSLALYKVSIEDFRVTVEDMIEFFPNEDDDHDEQVRLARTWLQDFARIAEIPIGKNAIGEPEEPPLDKLEASVAELEEALAGLFADAGIKASAASDRTGEEDE